MDDDAAQAPPKVAQVAPKDRPPLLEADRALLDAFRRGERQALGRVYFHYVDDVAALVRHGFLIESRNLRVAGAPDADGERDLVQEVFVRAFAERARLSYDGIRPYRPYLLRIAKNLLIDQLRRREPALVLDEEAEALVPAEPAPNPPEDLHWRRLSEATSHYLAELSAEQRELVRLRFEEERSQIEAAEQMHVSRRRVRTLEARVQAGLRRHLKRLKLLAE
jgi:RNA polymerase sigma-70 factor, ECF subfamily